MLDFFKSLFRPQRSGATAKERLRLVLLSDHLSLAPEMVEALKADLFDVFSRYFEYEPAQTEVSFEHREHEVAMLASVPIQRVRERPGRPLRAVESPPRPAAPVQEELVAPAPSAAASRPRRRRRRRTAGANGKPGAAVPPTGLPATPAQA